MTVHPFSPITTEEKLKLALQYIAEQSLLLAQKVIPGEKLEIDTLTIFSQSDAEFDFISRHIRKYGKQSPFTHGETLYISSNLRIDDHVIKFLGVRRPDSARTEVGYADYPVENYEQILKDYAGNPNVMEIASGRNQTLIELKHPDFDVRGYIVPLQLHDDSVPRPKLSELQ